MALGGILGLLFQTHVVRSEVHVGEGRYDIQIAPKIEGAPGFIFKIKHSKAQKEPSMSNLQKMASNALKQILERRYVEELIARKAAPIHCYGIAFYKKKRAVSYSQWNGK